MLESTLFLAVLISVALAGRFGVRLGVRGMGLGRMGVVGSLFVAACLVVLGGFGVVFGGLRVVGGGLLVAISCLLRHDVGIYRTARCWPAHFITKANAWGCKKSSS